MQFKNEQAKKEWEQHVALNDDLYGSGVVRYARAWAELMEQQLATEGTDNVASIAKQSSHDADTEGITGFMYGCAVGILSQVWKHGEELRQWHNLATQTKDEGERANREGGVLNPASLNLGD